ncbi:CYTH domain-containing protein [Engelhardtia mirabilis]|uniref:CYTH domain-containing protein n=1 Tax=Engelhardtia mirabilis TaxID=2528011 RepID=UPI003AF405F7
MNPPPIETEYCWVVLPPDTRSTLDAVASATRLGALHLEPLPPVDIDDTILDRPDGALGALGLTLRLRIEGGAPALLTIKGPTRLTADGATTRAELERPFSKPALIAALAFLEGLGGPPTPALDAIGELGSEPRAALAQLGFIEVQRRRNLRRRSMLLGPDGSRLAELAIDEVRFRAGEREVGHAELELELVGGTPDQAAPAIAALEELARPHLRAWPHSKTALARLLADAARDGRLAGWLDPGGHLTASAYPELSALLGA